ncbi:hypothetical protein T492DRAFT_848461 [Pavlovales sp. CCMP2436]|nr:hypothetical protein T492DRAFT_848461 [Pavlovales sp. CCMP2436]
MVGVYARLLLGAIANADEDVQSSEEREQAARDAFEMELDAHELTRAELRRLLGTRDLRDEAIGSLEAEAEALDSVLVGALMTTAKAGRDLLAFSLQRDAAVRAAEQHAKAVEQVTETMKIPSSKYMKIQNTRWYKG